MALDQEICRRGLRVIDDTLNTVARHLRPQKGIVSKTGGREKKYKSPDCALLGAEQRSRPAMATFKFLHSDVEGFKQFASLMARGEYVPEHHQVPLGYVDFCVTHQHDPDEALRLPLPVGISTQSITTNGRKTIVVVPEHVLPAPLGKGAVAAAGGTKARAKASRKPAIPVECERGHN